MSARGGDPADQALDDALALANDHGRRPDVPRPSRQPDQALDDALALANDHGRRPDVPRPSRRSGADRTDRFDDADRPAPNDPLAVALSHDVPVVPAPARPSSSAPDPRPAPARRGAPATSWPEARRLANAAGRRLDPRPVPLDERALGSALARGLKALTDLPSFDTSAMDGWAVAGEGPWRTAGQVLAGQRAAGPLRPGEAVRIATGAALPPGATAVLRSEHGATEARADGEWLRVAAPHPAPVPGQEIRRRGQECRRGDELLPAGSPVTPVVLGLAAAAGYDELTVTARPRVEVLVLGDELLDHGVPRAGRVRDALGPMLPSWLRALGAEVTAVRRLVDDAEALREAITGAVTGARADLVITTGGTAGGPVDHVHAVLATLGAKLLVDGVAVRPGHPMVLAELPAGGRSGRTGASSGSRVRHLIGLPGNPLAAVSGVLTLVAPLLGTLAGRPVPPPYTAPLTSDVSGHPVDTRLVPVAFDDESAARPLHFAGPAMLRGLAAADGLAVIPPGGVRAGREVTVLDTGMPGAGSAGPAWGSGG